MLAVALASFLFAAKKLLGSKVWAAWESWMVWPSLYFGEAGCVHTCGERNVKSVCPPCWEPTQPLAVGPGVRPGAGGVSCVPVAVAVLGA